MNNASAAFFRASNLIIMDYPFDGALASALHICDEACIVVGQSVDETRDWVYALRDEYGQDRVKVREETFTFDRGWQERWWNWCREMTTADWQMYHDADEAISESEAPRLRELFARDGIDHIVFPYVHLYGTIRWQTAGLRFYDHNARLGRSSAGYRMRNWCSDDHPTWAACQMVVQRAGREVDAHNARDRVVWSGIPMIHYGWCRTPHAIAISQVKHRAWYADGAGLADGHVPEVEPYDYQLSERIRTGGVVPFTGEHPAYMERWLHEHATVWHELEAQVDRGL